MMPVNVARLDQIRAAIAAQDAALANMNEHITMMAQVQTAQRNVYVALEHYYFMQGAKRVAEAYSTLVDTMAKRDALELQQFVIQRDAMVQGIEQMRSQLELLENPSPIIGVDLRSMKPHN